MKEENQAIIKAINMYGRVPEQWELLNEIERLENNNQAMQEEMARTWEQLDKTNNIINELEKKLLELRLTDVDGKTIVYRLLDKLQELKGDSSNE